VEKPISVGVGEAQEIVKAGPATKMVTATSFNWLQTMASHISYHLGEVVLMRRMLGLWPPPSGGYTW
jgi:hypothetical protein